MSDFKTIFLALFSPLVIGLIYACLRRRTKLPTLSHVLLASGSLQSAKHS
jgi:hypothetical protein